MAPSRPEPPQYAGGPYQPNAPGRDAREPRYAGQPEYADPRADPRYAYPSPAITTVSMSARDREPITSPPQLSTMNPAQYDQYGRREYRQSPARMEWKTDPAASAVMSPPVQDERRVLPPSRDPAYGREDRRERPPTGASRGGDEAHRSSRRRVG
ncbi:hypothetical protein LTR53_005249 [Teratosphaeriaceae sp. CCFEE 6253]|nr:hypothetical protein LTR53_005249 [Teratosphaeriaceae sp. CCFEE 6253]